MREINQAGLALIKHFEGCSLKAYLCPAGILTIGYGHTGPDVTNGKVISQTEAEYLLNQDLLKFCSSVSDLVKVPINDNQFSALVSFVYNLGTGALRSSTLLKLVNSKDFQKAGLEFSKWTKSKGQVLPGLVKRREAERTLFNG